MNNTERPQQKVEYAEDAERLALGIALIFGLAQLLSVVLLYSRGNGASLVNGPNSVGAHALISSLVIALLISPLAYLRGLKFRYTSYADTKQGEHRWSVVPVTIGTTLLALLLVTIGFEVISRAFINVKLDLASTAAILTLLTGVLTYLIVTRLMLTRTSALLVHLAVFYLFATLFFSTYGQDNPIWWQRSFSYLGMNDSNTKLIFDLGLILTGILILAWQHFFMDAFALLGDQKLINPRSITIVRLVLIAAGIALAFVGIFRYGLSPLTNVIHDVSATGVGVVSGLLMISLRWVVPGYQRIFYLISAVMAFLMLLAAALKVAGFYSLVGLELGAFVLAGLWLLLFYRNTELLVARVLVDVGNQDLGEKGSAHAWPQRRINRPQSPVGLLK